MNLDTKQSTYIKNREEMASMDDWFIWLFINIKALQTLSMWLDFHCFIYPGD